MKEITRYQHDGPQTGVREEFSSARGGGWGCLRFASMVAVMSKDCCSFKGRNGVAGMPKES